MPKKQLIEVEGRELAISNVDKVYFPESGFTKGEVIAFYSEIADDFAAFARPTADAQTLPGGD